MDFWLAPPYGCHFCPSPGLAAPIPFYVILQLRRPEINVGPLSGVLALATPDTIGVMAEAWRPALAYQPATTLFVLAVRLFDLGQHAEGLYWFYQAQYRARLLHRLLDAGLGELAESLRAGWDAMQAQRRANGTHARFCGPE